MRIPWAELIRVRIDIESEYFQLDVSRRMLVPRERQPWRAICSAAMIDHVIKSGRTVTVLISGRWMAHRGLLLDIFR